MHQQKTPANSPSLRRIAAFQNAIKNAEAERDRALLFAAEDGASLREIGIAAGLSASTVLRMVRRAEAASTQAAPQPPKTSPLSASEEGADG